MKSGGGSAATFGRRDGSAPASGSDGLGDYVATIARGSAPRVRERPPDGHRRSVAVTGGCGSGGRAACICSPARRRVIPVEWPEPCGADVSGRAP